MFETIDIGERVGNGFNNLTGRDFGRLTVLGLSAKKVGRKSYWVCQCSCGNKKIVRSDLLIGGKVRSCGCLKKEQDNINLDRTTHGQTTQGYSRLWGIWEGMKKRCSNPKDTNYMKYGARGIKVCKEWQHSFEAFQSWSITHGYKDDLTIERLDVNKGYNPDNCAWILGKNQANNRRSSIFIEWDGQKLNLKQWSKKLGINYGTLNSRYKRDGMRPPELFMPVKRKHRGN